MTGAAGAGLASGGLLHAFDQFFQPAGPLSAGGQTLITACGLCDSACGMRALVEDDVLRHIEGLPADLHGAGGLCAKGASAAAWHYDPDRLKYPMMRTNPRKGLDEDPGWVRISWQEALDAIALRFQSYVQQYGPDSLLFVTRGSPDLWMRFMNSIGILNRVDHNDECYLVSKVIQKYAAGGHSFAHDYENARYILLFGWDLVARGKIVHSRGLVAAKENGAKVVCFNPQYSSTARMSDEWHPIRPGSDLAVALAMIQIIVTENRYNKDFLDNYTNFGEYEQQIRQHFQEFTPEWAEQESDVPADVIRRIAREFASQLPSVAPVHKKTLCANYANATQLVHAIEILNTLAGNIDRPGGRYFPRTISIPGVDAVYPPPKYPAKTGRRVDGRNRLPLADEGNNGMFTTLADGMLNTFPGLIKGVFWQSYSLNSFPQPERVAEALKTAEFMAVMDVLPVDATYFADVLLPSTNFLEGSDLVSRTANARSPQVVVRQQVTRPLFERRSLGWVAIELGKRMAPDYFRKPDGAWISPSELLDEKTRRADLAGSFAEFRTIGVLTREQPFTPRIKFNTASGKCQVYVPEFAAKGYDPLPGWKPKRELPSAEFPYYLLTFIPSVHRRNSTQNNPILHEMFPSNSAMMNGALALKLGIQEGQTVRIRSRVGAIELPAHLTETLRPDCVMVAHGFGHVSRMLPLAGGKGARDSDLIPDLTIDEMIAAGNFAGAGCIMDAVVSIEPI